MAGGRSHAHTKREEESGKAGGRQFPLLFKFEAGLTVEIAGIKLHLTAAAEREDEESLVPASASRRGRIGGG